MRTASPSLGAPSPEPRTFDSIDPQTLLTRTQLAKMLEACGTPLTYHTLATKATRGGGPPFSIFGKNAIYLWSDVVAWVRETIGEPARTTSEHRIRPKPGPEKLAAMVEGKRRYDAARKTPARSSKPHGG